MLCGNTLFRVHTTILSFHSPVLRRMFTQTNLTMAELPNGCPRILSSDDPKDFSTLLKMIYLPGSAALPEYRWIVLLTICLSTDSLNGIRCRVSPYFLPSSESRQSTMCPPSDLSYLRSFAMRIQRPLRGWILPDKLENASSADLFLTRDRKSTRLNSSHLARSRMPSSA